MKSNILIAEDDEDIIELISLYLSCEDYDIFTANNGLEALAVLDDHSVDLAVIDIMMPKMNGYDFIKAARKQKKEFPIIVISAKNMDEDRILGLNLGADVYLPKPFNPLEVVAYVKALLRRNHTCSETETDSENRKKKTVLCVGELTLDLFQAILKKEEEIIPLTTTEIRIMSKFMQSPGQVFTKAQLYTCIGGELYESDENTMMVHISNIRSKLEDNPSKPKYIKTVRGLGYKIEAL